MLKKTPTDAPAHQEFNLVIFIFCLFSIVARKPSQKPTRRGHFFDATSDFVFQLQQLHDAKLLKHTAPVYHYLNAQ